MKKPNYRLRLETEEGQTRILGGLKLRNKGGSMEEKTFCFTNCSCDSECECDEKPSCTCNSQKRYSCNHCYCVDHKEPCNCEDHHPSCRGYDKCSCERVTCEDHDSNNDYCIPYDSPGRSSSEPCGPQGS